MPLQQLAIEINSKTALLSVLQLWVGITVLSAGIGLAPAVSVSCQLLSRPDTGVEETDVADELPEFAIWRIEDTEATARGVFHVAWSPNGQSVAIQNRGNLLTVFDFQTREKLFSKLNHENNWIECIDFSPDSKHIITAAGSGETVKVVEAISGELVLEVDTTAMAAFFSRCGQFVLLLGQDNVQHYSFPEGKLEKEVVWRTDQEAALGMSKAGELLVTYRSIGRQNYLSEMVIPKNQVRIPMAGANSIPGNMAISSCQRRVAIGYPGESRIFFWEIQDAQAVRYLLREHKEPAQGLAISPCGRLLASADSEGTIIVWDLILRQPVQRLVDSSQDCRHLAFSYDGQYLLSGSASVQNQSATIWDLTKALYRQLADDSIHFDQLWEKLGSSQTKVSLGASSLLIRKFSDYQNKLREQLDADLAQDLAGDLRQWIDRLSDHRFEIRESATQQLANRIADFKPKLKEYLENETNPEIRYRITRVLKQGKRNPKISLIDTRRWQRLVFALEKVDSPLATEFLEMIAIRHEHSRIRNDARDSLERLLQEGQNSIQ